MVTGDDISASFSTTATQTSPVNSYQISATLNDPNGRLTNYTVTNTPGLLTVTPAALAIGVQPVGKVYGTANPAFTPTYSGFVNNDTASVLAGTLTYTTGATSSSGVGSYTVTPGGVTAANYTITFNPGTLTITPVGLTAQVNNATRVYGWANPTFTGTLTGVMGGDNITATYSSLATTSSAAGNYAITATLADPGNKLSNYTVTNTPGTLTITSATLSIGVQPATKVYGAANPTFTPTFTGYVNGDTASVLTGTLNFTTTATAASGVGGYPVTPGGVTSANYAITFTSGTLTVAPSLLAVTATNQNRASGTANPALTYTITGYVNGDTSAVVSGAASCSTTATSTSPAGSYPITCTQGTMAATNYTFGFAAGSLTVTATGLDLVEENVSTSGSPLSGGAIQITDTVLNQGSATAGASTSGFYLSVDGVTKGTYLGYRYVGALSPAAVSGPVTTTLTLPVSLNGTYYLLACANYNNQVVESNTANNCAASPAFAVGPADLIESAVSVLTSAPVAGGSLQISDTVTNQGIGAASSSTTGFYISIDGKTKGTYLGYRYVGTIIALGNSGAATSTVTLPTNLNGTYYVIACANYNNGIVESNTANNCTASAAMTVAPADLAETAVSVLTTAPVSGGSVQVIDTLANQGLGSAAGSNTGSYLSTNGTTKGAYLGYRSVGVLSPGGVSGPVTTTLTLPASLNGAYYIMVCADYANLVAEANKANNCMASAQIKIAGAELVESSFSVPTSAASGGNVQVSDTVTNQGVGNAASSTTGFYLSTNGTTKGTYLGYRYVGVLSPGGISGPVTTTMSLPTNLSGTYYLIVCANYNNGIVETSTSNNCTTSTSMQVH